MPHCWSLCCSAVAPLSSHAPLWCLCCTKQAGTTQASHLTKSSSRGMRPVHACPHPHVIPASCGALLLPQSTRAPVCPYASITTRSLTSGLRVSPPGAHSVTSHAFHTGFIPEPQAHRLSDAVATTCAAASASLQGCLRGCDVFVVGRAEANRGVPRHGGRPPGAQGAAAGRNHTPGSRRLATRSRRRGL